MTLNMLKALGIALLLGFAPAGPVYATADLVVDRGLPTANLNDAAGLDRSNIAWGGYQTGVSPDAVLWFTGDTFRMPDLSAGQQWTIDTIRIWSPAIEVGSGGNTPQLGDIYDSITLYGGAYQDRPPDSRSTPLGKLSTGTISGNTSGNPDIQFTRVYYNNDNTTNYQGAVDYQIWQVDFTHLNWVVDPLTLIEFGINATGSDFWYNHASNAALSGSPQEGANGWFSQIAADLMLIYDCDSGDPADADFCGWNKSSDINVQVFADPAPAPGSLALALIGLFGLSAVRRTKARSAMAQPAP